MTSDVAQGSPLTLRLFHVLAERVSKNRSVEHRMLRCEIPPSGGGTADLVCKSIVFRMGRGRGV